MANQTENQNPISPAGAAANTSSAPVPAQTQPTPNPMPAPSPNPASADANNAASIASVVPAAQAPTPASGANMSATEHQSRIGKVFQDIAGGQTTDYVQGPNGPVPVKRNLKPGEMARTILSSALSLISAGAGGDLAAKEHRQYVQPESQTIGGMRQEQNQAKQQEAQKEFTNKQAADEQILRAHKAASDQQLAAAQLGKDKDEHELAVQALARGDQEAEGALHDRVVRQYTDYNKAMNMPGAEVMKGPNGKELNFVTADEAQQYAIAHPEVLHGSSNGISSRYGVIPVTNPWTGQIQFVDYPADRHDMGLIYVGQKKDKNGNPMFDAKGEPVPDGRIIDPKTKKPTVLTRPVSPDEAQTIFNQNLSDEETEAKIMDFDAQAKLRDSEVAKNEALTEAQDVYNDGSGISKMTPKQKQVMQRFLLTIMDKNRLAAATALQKAQQLSGDPKNPDVVNAQKQYSDAQDSYEDSLSRYNQLAGNTPGTILANKILRTDGANLNWDDANKKINAGALSDTDKQTAQATIWNAMSPAQQAAAPKEALYDPQGAKHSVPAGFADQYLTSPQYKGWHK